MSLTVRRVGRSLVASTLIVCLTAAVASAQAPTLTASSEVVVPGASVTLTVAGTPGEHFAVVGSVVGAGASYGGLPLAVGEDFAVLAVGQLDGMGRATVPFVPPFLGSVLDRVYLQAATSPSPSFLPAALSAGRVLRNHDLVAGLSGVAGPVGPVGAAGATGLPGAAGLSGAAGSMGPAGAPGASGGQGPIGPAGVQGLQGLQGVGFRADCGGNNVAIWSVSQTAWTCSTALTDLLAAVQTLTARVTAFEPVVDYYLNTLVLSSAIPVGTALAIQNNNNGTACLFRTGGYYLNVFGFDNQNGLPGGLVDAYDLNGSGSFSVSGNIPVSTAQVLARCATGQPYIVAR